MAEQHEINEIVKRIDNKLLEQLFERLGVVDLDEEWKKSTNRNIKPLCDALAKLPDSVQDEVGLTLEEMAPVGRENKNIPVIIATLADMHKETPAGFGEWNAARMATWSWLNLNELQWGRLRGRALINNFNPGEWKSFDLQFEDEPKRGLLTERKAVLEKAIVKAISRSEYRGRHCKSECYNVGDRENIVFKLTDHKSADEFWDDAVQDFKPTETSKAFKVVLSFDYDNYRMSILYTSNPKQCKVLSGVLADALFGEGGYKRIEEVRYTISQFKDKSKLPSMPSVGIKSATVIGLDILLDGSKKRRRSYFEADRDLQETIKEELSADLLNLESTIVQRVMIRITYDSDKKSDVPRTFKISETSIGGLMSAPKKVQKAFKEYMRKHGITKTDDEDNGNTNSASS